MAVRSDEMVVLYDTLSKIRVHICRSPVRCSLPIIGTSTECISLDKKSTVWEDYRLHRPALKRTSGLKLLTYRWLQYPNPTQISSPKMSPIFLESGSYHHGELLNALRQKRDECIYDINSCHLKKIPNPTGPRLVLAMCISECFEQLESPDHPSTVLCESFELNILQTESKRLG